MPAGYWAFVLVPAIATFAAGRFAGAGASGPHRFREAPVRGAGAGVVFAPWSASEPGWRVRRCSSGRRTVWVRRRSRPSTTVGAHRPARARVGAWSGSARRVDPPSPRGTGPSGARRRIRSTQPHLGVVRFELGEPWPSCAAHPRRRGRSVQRAACPAPVFSGEDDGTHPGGLEARCDRRHDAFGHPPVEPVEGRVEDVVSRPGVDRGAAVEDPGLGWLVGCCIDASIATAP